MALATPTIAELATRAYLKPAQRQQLEHGVQMAEETIRAQGQILNGRDVNVDAVQRNMAKDRQMLDAGTPPDYPGGIKNRLFHNMRALEKKLKYDMPTLDEMERPIPANVDKHMAWERVHKSDILAWKAIRRILSPLNAEVNFTNIETLRSNTPSKGDPRRYWEKFGNIQWEEDLEEELLYQLSDEDYLKFLEMRVLNWSEASIRRGLSWDKKQYAAAVERFRRSSQVTDADAQAQFDLDDSEPPEEGDEPEPSEEEEEDEPEPSEGDDADEGEEVPEITAGSESKWPLEEMQRRGLSFAVMTRRSGLNRLRLGVLLSGKNNAKWRPQEREAVEAVLRDWDKAHAFAGAVATVGVTEGGE